MLTNSFFLDGYRVLNFLLGDQELGDGAPGGVESGKPCMNLHSNVTCSMHQFISSTQVSLMRLQHAFVMQDNML